METYCEQYRVRFSEVDRNDRLRLRTFFDYAQEVAGIHAGKLGVSSASLWAMRQAWMVSRMRIRIMNYPAAMREVRVKTWPSGFDKLFAVREYEFSYADSGQLFAEASSCWLIVDTEHKRILPASRRLVGSQYEELAKEEAKRLFPSLDRMHPLQEELPMLRTFVATEAMIDGNCHVNNAEYAGMLQDAFGPGCYPQEFQINYNRAIPPESTVELHGRRNPSGEFRLAGLVEGTPAFEIDGIWR